MVKGKSLDEMECFESVLKATAKDRSVPKLTDWDFGIPPLQTTFLVKPSLRTLMEPTINCSYQK